MTCGSILRQAGSPSSSTPSRAKAHADGGGVNAGRNSPLEVFRVFLKLGLTSFGGPIAHIGYFRDEFVVRRGWLDEAGFADLVALCQFLPGPASSQTGFAIGLLRTSYLGGLAAWIGFTLPSAIAMTLFAYGASAFKGRAAEGLLHGLKLVAVAVVAQAVMGMAQNLAPDRPRAAIAVVAVIATAFAPGSLSQISAIVFGGLAGLVLCRPEGQDGTSFAQSGRAEEERGNPVPVSRRMGLACLAAFLALLGLSFSPPHKEWLALLAAVYRSGALVFGGGHVVLPLLRAAVVSPGWVSDGAFLAGYGAAQAVPGPLFSFAAYIGVVASAPPGGVVGAALALIAIFAPGLLALMGALPFWHDLRARQGSRAAMAGVNAAVVGLLASALYNPVFMSAVRGPADFAVAATGFALLVAWRAPPIIVVVLTAVTGALLGAAG
jgi:chromate transporter